MIGADTHETMPTNAMCSSGVELDPLCLPCTIFIHHSGTGLAPAVSAYGCEVRPSARLGVAVVAVVEAIVMASNPRKGETIELSILLESGDTALVRVFTIDCEHELQLRSMLTVRAGHHGRLEVLQSRSKTHEGPKGPDPECDWVSRLLERQRSAPSRGRQQQQLLLVDVNRGAYRPRREAKSLGAHARIDLASDSLDALSSVALPPSLDALLLRVCHDISERVSVPVVSVQLSGPATPGVGCLHVHAFEDLPLLARIGAERLDLNRIAFGGVSSAGSAANAEPEMAVLRPAAGAPLRPANTVATPAPPAPCSVCATPMADGQKAFRCTVKGCRVAFCCRRCRDASAHMHGAVH
jgi:hypothetical protein